jgi:hypothetical protein
MSPTPRTSTPHVVIHRKRVAYTTRKTDPLQLFSPDDGHFEYSAVTPSADLTPASLWVFLAGRGAQKKPLFELNTRADSLTRIPNRQVLRMTQDPVTEVFYPKLARALAA